MSLRLSFPTPRFAWSELRGRCRTRLAAGLIVLAIAAAYAAWAGHQFAVRGGDTRAFDQPLVHLAARMTPPPAGLRGIQPRNDRELYLLAVITDQQDVLFGLTVLVLRMIVALTVGGIGLVLLTAGSTEWEMRSERARAAARSGLDR
jgi:hypothetical protein